MCNANYNGNLQYLVREAKGDVIFRIFGHVDSVSITSERPREDLHAALRKYASQVKGE